LQFVRYNKEIVASEDETENTCLNNVCPWIGEIDSAINHLLKNPPPDACPFNDFTWQCEQGQRMSMY
jgi:hypothetical protein